MGVRITGKFEPSWTGDTYAILEDIYFKGGYRVCSGKTERNSITYFRRSLGMMVRTEDDRYWVLINNPAGDFTIDSDWKEFVGGSGGTDGTSGSSGTSGIDGSSGSSGISGTDGTSGSSGSSGISGTDGTWDSRPG